MNQDTIEKAKRVLVVEEALRVKPTLELNIEYQELGIQIDEFAKALLAASERERELERKLAIAVDALERLIDFQIGYRSVFGLRDGPKTEHCLFLNPAKEALAKIKEGEK